MAGIVYYSQEKYFHQLQQAAAVGLEKFSNDLVLQFFKAYGVLREERTQDAISSLERIRSHPDVSLCSTMALIYAHKHCEVIDQEAVQALKSSLKEMHQTPSGTALYYASLFLWLTGQHGKAKEYISCTLKASSSSREVPAPGRHLSAGLPQEPALCAPEAWPAFTMPTQSLDSVLEDFEFYELAGACDMGDIVAFRNIFLSIVYCLVFALGLVGNLLVVFALINSRGPKSITDIYLLNLALSDLLFVATLPFWTHYLISQQGFNNAVCKLTTAFFFVGFFGGIFFITIISIDRYQAIVLAANSMNSRTVQHGVTVSLSVWAAAALLATPQFMFTKEADNECFGNFPEALEEIWPVLRNMEVVSIGFLLPLIILTYCYFRIIRTLCSCKNHKKAKAIRLILLVVITFFLFWTPYNVMLFLDTLDLYDFFPSCDVKRTLRLAINVTETIAFTHCCLNPLIYAFAGEKFRRYLLHLHKRCLAGRRGHPAHVSFTPWESQSSRRESMLSSSLTHNTSEGKTSILL